MLILMLINYSNLWKRKLPLVNITQRLLSMGCAALSDYEVCMSV